jgi:hypothetical protein
MSIVALCLYQTNLIGAFRGSHSEMFRPPRCRAFGKAVEQRAKAVGIALAKAVSSFRYYTAITGQCRSVILSDGAGHKKAA